MNTFKNYNQLSPTQIEQYRAAVIDGFPAVINASPVSKKYWKGLEQYFPEVQFFLIADNEELIGFMNTVPFYFSETLDQLPDRGWDWMFEKGVTDHENNIVPNYLGGLQVIVRKEFQKLGKSKQLLNYAKQYFKAVGFSNLVIPIRPTKKYLFPEMAMETYLNLKEKNEIYDPWIRTHLKNGAQLIKVCENSMSISGDLTFWEMVLDKEIIESGPFISEGLLNPVMIDKKTDSGIYNEPNIWIKYL